MLHPPHRVCLLSVVHPCRASSAASWAHRCHLAFLLSSRVAGRAAREGPVPAAVAEGVKEGQGAKEAGPLGVEAVLGPVRVEWGKLRPPLADTTITMNRTMR